MENLVVALSSPLGLMVLLCIFCGIAFAVRISALNYNLLSIVDNAASGMGLVFILLLAATFSDLSVTCRILLDNGLLQAEFVVITLTALWHMALRYVRNFDP